MKFVDLLRSAGYGLLLMILYSAPLHSAEWVEREFAKFRLLSAGEKADGAGLRLAGLEVELAPGWQFYHEKPGEFGVAPIFDWTKSRNLKKVDLHWPPPKKLRYSVTPPVTTRGYTDALLLPISFMVSDHKAEADIRVDLEYAVCNEFCVVDKVQLTLSEMSDPERAGHLAENIRKAIAGN